MSNDLIVMDNSLVTSAYSLTLNEQRLIYCALKQIPKGEPIDPKTPFFITRDDFIELGVNPDIVAREIRHATRELMKKTVLIRNNSGILQFHWLSEVLRYDRNAEQKLKIKYPNPKDYNKYINALRAYNLLDALPIHKDNDNIVARVIFHEKIVPLLSDLRASFTQFALSDVASFSSIYTFRIYQLMMQYKSTGYVKIDLDDLRYMLLLLDKYPLVADLKRWVIEVAVNEINEKSPYKASYKMIKKGRKFAFLELKFSLKDKEKKSLKHERDSNVINIFDNLKDKERAIIQTKIDDYIRHKESKGEIINNFHRQNITNKAIAEKWGIAEYQQQQAQEQAEKERHAQALAKQQAEAKRQQQKVQKQEAENRAFVKYFESLPQDEQNRIIGEVGNAIAPLFKEYFDEAVANGTAHKDLMYRSFFRQVMDL